MRTLLSALFWLVASKLVGWAVAVNPAPVRRVLEADGPTLRPAFPRVEEYARVLTASEAAWVCLSLKVHIGRMTGQVQA
jgi:hypothetical protein